MTTSDLLYDGMPVGEPLQFQVTAKEVIQPGMYGQCVLRDPNASEANSITVIDVEDIHRENCIFSRERFPVLFDPDSGKYIPQGSRGLVQRAICKHKISKGKSGTAVLLRAKNGENAGKVEVVDIEFISTSDLDKDTNIWVVWKKDFARHGANQGNGEAPSSFGMWCQFSSGGAGEGQLIDTLNDTSYAGSVMDFRGTKEQFNRLVTHASWVSGHNDGWWSSQWPLCDRHGTYHLIIPLEYHMITSKFAHDKLWEDKAGSYDLTARYMGAPSLTCNLWISKSPGNPTTGQCLSSVKLGGKVGTQIVNNAGATSPHGNWSPLDGILGQKTDTATMNVVFNLSENDNPFGLGSSRPEVDGYHLWLECKQTDFDFNSLDAGMMGSFTVDSEVFGESWGQLELGHSVESTFQNPIIRHRTLFSLTYYSDPGHPNLDGLQNLD